jgi:voltage-gated potassium channel
MPNGQYGYAYNLFIFVLTVVSLVVMVLLWLPLNPETIGLLRSYDNAICVLFVADFFVALRRARSPRAYIVGEHGWLDLVGSVPTSSVAPVLGLLRLARIGRLRRISRGLSRQSKAQLIADLLHNRAQYAVLTTVLAAFLVMATGSVIVLEAESRSAEGNIRTGADAFWWAMVTITTVGYGDHFPISTTGRVAAIFIMVAGIGIIGALASVMSKFLVNPSGMPPAALDLERKLDRLANEVAAARDEVASLRRAMQSEGNGELKAMDAPSPTPHAPER